MSRPALYLVFESKEAVFKAVLGRHLKWRVAEVRTGLKARDDVHETLMDALEIWCVRPFEMTLTSPDTKDLLESGYEFAGEIVRAGFDEFEQIVARELEPCTEKTGSKLSSRQIAHILVSAAVGFKQVSPTADVLRQMIAGLLTMVLASLRAPASRKHD